jgi:D-3-phosphoglycerate dehydrogenase
MFAVTGHSSSVTPLVDSRRSRPLALVTAPLAGPGLERLDSLVELVLDPWTQATPLRIYSGEQLAERARSEGATILVVEADSCSGPVFELPLLAIATCRGDPTNVDLGAASRARIPVLHTPGRNADGVAELMIAMLLALTRHIPRADADVRAGKVFQQGTIPYQRFRSWEIVGRTAGLIGLGAVGHAVKWRLEALGMHVLAVDPRVPEANATLEEVLRQADVLSLHAPLDRDTVGMIGAGEFAAMKDGVVFLNTARAQLHDLDALVGALRSGKVAAAGLDHFEGEQLPIDHPLCSMENVLLTPHIGGATYNTEVRQTDMVADDIARLLTGARPVHLANPEVMPGD